MVQLLELCAGKRSLIESFLSLVSKIKDRVGRQKVYQDEGKLLVKLRSEKMSKSARFAERVLRSGATQSSSLPEGWGWTGSFFRF
ncbi:hypothetical protein FH972_001911 [Carpinus fangiana]|uniref:Uncharacterized protein n=1 Tax=Carpinus fangiana TaxID=176857 RepID=A0A5N6QGE4_9ROSI|nr:hypothetical protein FH972_001911 [Carpinus fangiana]